MSHWFHENKLAQEYLSEGRATNILEMGTGTGLLGIYLALKLKNESRIVLTDLEKPSLDITKQNVLLNMLSP